MQNEQRIHEQVEEMQFRTEVRAAVAEDHAKLVAARKRLAQKELVRAKVLRDGFVLAEQILSQRKAQAEKGESPPEAVVLEGMQGAIDELVRLRDQTREMIAKAEGAFQALGALEETLVQTAQMAESRVRGLEVAGERAGKVASARYAAKEPISLPAVETGSQES